VCRIPQHYGGQIARGGRSVHLPAKPELFEQGQPSGVVDMGVGQQYEVHIDGGYGEALGKLDVYPLRQTAIDKHFAPASLKEVTASRDFTRRSEK
jgi:hypothetical protein